LTRHPRVGGAQEARSAQQAAQTRQAAQRDAREADALERQRLLAERVAARQGPALIGRSKLARQDDAPCTKGNTCARGEAASKRRDKAHTVTLYRAVDTR
jgi:hypothetical protein